MRQAPQSDTNSNKAEAGTDVSVADRGRNIFGTEGKATDYFAASSYRRYQRETIEEIEAAFEQGYKYVVVNAPTGAGKSHMARALAFQSDDAHIITIQKLLQDQYQVDFPDMFVMKGRSAYRCVAGEAGESCAHGLCRLKKRPSCSNCPYTQAKISARASSVTVHNFDSFYYQTTYSGAFSGRKLLVIDEAHNISSKVAGFLEFTIDSRGGIPVPELATADAYDEFITGSREEYQRELKVLEIEHETIGLSKARLGRMNDLGSLIRKLDMYVNSREGRNPIDYVFEYAGKGRFAPKVTFKPIQIGGYAKRCLFNYGERVLMFSATFLDRDMFCNEVGIKPKDAYYIDVPSTFPAENRKIIKKYAGDMSYKHINMTLPRVAEVIQEIADRFPDRKGIVQTHSDKIANYLQSNLLDDRFTYNKDFDSPQQMLEVHKRKPGSIIIASGLREGLDLRGDLSKIQVFCKIPYPSLGDKWVKRKMELDRDWYGWMTSVMFVQSLGRSVRSPTERAVTYILDSGFGKFYGMNKRFIPEYIKEAIK